MHTSDEHNRRRRHGTESADKDERYCEQLMDRLTKLKNCDITDIACKLHRRKHRNTSRTEDMEVLRSHRKQATILSRNPTNWEAETLRLPPINQNTSLVSRDKARCLYAADTKRSNCVFHNINVENDTNIMTSAPTKTRHRTQEYVPYTAKNKESSTYINGVLHGSSMGAKLKSGNVRYKNILPPIGETYKLRAREYYADVIEQVKCPPSSPAEECCEEFLEVPIGLKADWLEDFVENMRKHFCEQDDQLQTFLKSENANRRTAICDELDRFNDHVGNAEHVRHKMISDIISMYF